MKKLVILLSAAMLLMLATVSVNAADTKIGVIDLHSIMQKSSKARSINATLKKRFQPRQKKIVAKQKALGTEIAKLKRNAAVMSAAEKSRAQNKIVADQRDLKRLEQDFQEDLAMAQNQAMQQFLADVHKAVNKVAKRGHYVLILQRDAVPYASANVDVTNDVLRSLS